MLDSYFVVVGDVDDLDIHHLQELLFPFHNLFHVVLGNHNVRRQIVLSVFVKRIRVKIVGLLKMLMAYRLSLR